jgi:hypothetical protein
MAVDIASSARSLDRQAKMTVAPQRRSATAVLNLKKNKLICEW